MTKSTLAPRSVNIVRAAIVLGIAALLAWSVPAAAENEATDWQETLFLERNTVLPEVSDDLDPVGEPDRPIFDNVADARFYDDNVALHPGSNNSARFQEVERPIFDNYLDARFYDDNVTLIPGVAFPLPLPDDGAPPPIEINAVS